MIVPEYSFGDYKIYLTGGRKKSTGVSRASFLLSKIIPPLYNMDVLDLGCGIGYMSVGALSRGARKVIASDLNNVEGILRKNIKINDFDQKKLIFIKSDLFSNIPKNIKFDVIIANLPQHALPATSVAKKLKGKYGGYDGTDLVCRAFTEGVHYLKHGGRYYGSVSRLTNFKRTIILAETLYKVKIIKTVLKTLDKNEMTPYISEQEFYNHLKKLKEKKLIEYVNNKGTIKYKVHLCEFILKDQQCLRPFLGLQLGEKR